VGRRQAGAVSRQQILRYGVSDDVTGRLVSSGQWRRLALGIYAMGADTWIQRVWAGLLIGGKHAVVGLKAAAKLWNLPIDKGRWERDDPPIEIFVGRNHGVINSTDWWRFVRADREGQSVPRRTSIAQTIVDLSQTMTGDQMASLVGQAVSHHRVSPNDIRAVLNTTARHKQRTLLADIVSDTADGVTSALEWHYVHDVEHAHGLPHARRQAKPVAIFTVDNFYEEYGVIVELDSKAYHRGVAASQDLERDRIHERNGYLTLRFTWADVVDHPCQTAAQVAATLSVQGWRGALTHCPRCSGQRV